MISKPILIHTFSSILLLVLFSACAPVLKKANVSPPAAPGNNVLFVLGQSDVTEMNTYMQAFAELPAPDGFSFYTYLEADNTNRDFQNALNSCGN